MDMSTSTDGAKNFKNKGKGMEKHIIIKHKSINGGTKKLYDKINKMLINVLTPIITVLINVLTPRFQ